MSDSRPHRIRARWAAAVGLAVCGLAACGGGHHARPRHAAAAASPGTTPAPLPLGPAPRSQPGRARPNVVFVLTDDLAWNLVRFMPHVRQLRHRGLTFARYFVTDSLCCPSRSSIFTGRLPHDTGVFTNNPPDGGLDAFSARGEERETFAAALQRSGYETALMGKYLNGYDPRRSYGGGVPPGWSEWDVAGNGYPEFGYALNQDGRLFRYGFRPRAYLTDVISGLGQRFVARAARARRPFLLELATFAPHAPYVPAPRDARSFPQVHAPRDPAFGAATRGAPAWLSRYRPLTAAEVRGIDVAFRRRAESVQAVDRMIGAIEAELRRLRIARDTYIVFSSDNGLHMGEHRLLPGKLTAFDTDIRVPLIVAGPGVPHGRTVGQLAQNTDLAPTFLQLARLAVPPGLEGRSLVPFLHGRRVSGWRRAVLIEHHGPEMTPGDPDLPDQGAGNPNSYEAMRTAGELFVQYADGERELYDLPRDPWELRNVAGRASAAATVGLARSLAALRSCHGGVGCWRAEGGA